MTSDKKHAEIKAGFSFVELVVVLFILSLLAVTTMPRFLDLKSPQGLSRSKEWTALLSELRQQALREGKDFLLHIDLTTGRSWVSHETGDEETDTEVFFMVTAVTEVELLNQPESWISDTVIRFYSDGMTDPAMIHLDGGKDRGQKTLRLHPFLPVPEILEGEVRFDPCR